MVRADVPAATLSKEVARTPRYPLGLASTAADPAAATIALAEAPPLECLPLLQGVPPEFVLFKMTTPCAPVALLATHFPAALAPGSTLLCPIDAPEAGVTAWSACSARRSSHQRTLLRFFGVVLWLVVWLGLFDRLGVRRIDRAGMWPPPARRCCRHAPAAEDAAGIRPEEEDPEVEDPEVEDPEEEDPEVEDPEGEDPEEEDPEEDNEVAAAAAAVEVVRDNKDVSAAV